MFKCKQNVLAWVELDGGGVPSEVNIWVSERVGANQLFVQCRSVFDGQSSEQSRCNLHRYCHLGLILGKTANTEGTEGLKTKTFFRISFHFPQIVPSKLARMTSSTEEMRGTRGERVNLRAKCFRYRGFFQWVILGVFALLALYVFANTDLLHLRGNRQTVKVDDKGTKNLDSLKVVHQKGEIQQPLKLDTKNTEQKSNFDEPDSEEKDNVDDDTKNEQKNTKQIDLSQTQQQAMNPETSQDGGKTKKQEEKPEQKLSHETHVAEQPVVANPAKQGTVGGNVKFPFQDPSKSWHERVEDLVGRMTLDEVC